MLTQKKIVAHFLRYLCCCWGVLLHFPILSYSRRFASRSCNLSYYFRFSCSMEGNKRERGEEDVAVAVAPVEVVPKKVCCLCDFDLVFCFSQKKRFEPTRRGELLSSTVTGAKGIMGPRVVGDLLTRSFPP
jgi:hypothetical protein